MEDGLRTLNLLSPHVICLDSFVPGLNVYAKSAGILRWESLASEWPLCLRTTGFLRNLTGDRVLGIGLWFPAGPESDFRLTQGLRPGLSYAAPEGLDLGRASWSWPLVHFGVIGLLI
jgi:hypothetical protein